MGKRKTKKQKQATKKKSHSSLLGKKHKSPAKQQQPPQNGTSNTNGSTTNNKFTKLVSSFLPKPRTARNNSPSEEQLDFQRQMNSLVERSRASEQAAAQRRRNKNRRRNGKSQHQQQQQQPPAPIFGMKPASFGLQKTTNQLMEETMQQMGNMLGGGQNSSAAANTASAATSSSSLALALATIAPSDRTPVASNVHRVSVASASGIQGIPDLGGGSNNSNSNSNSNNNPFAALGSDDDSDHEGTTTSENYIQLPPSAPAIKFAPSSFSLGPSPSLLPTKTPPTTPTAATTGSRSIRHPDAGRRSSLFGMIAEETLEELHYQQQTGRGNDAADDDDDL